MIASFESGVEPPVVEPPVIELLIVEQLMAELTGKSADQVVALRGNQRLIQRFDPVRIERPVGKIPGLADVDTIVDL